MEKEKKFGMIIEGDGTRQEMEAKAFENLKPKFLAMLRKYISKAYEDNGCSDNINIQSNGSCGKIEFRMTTGI